MMKQLVYWDEAYAGSRGEDVIKEYANKRFPDATVEIQDNGKNFTIDGYLYKIEFESVSMSSRPHVQGYFRLFAVVEKVKAEGGAA